MDCQHVRDQLVWYIIGELDEAERDAVEEHLAGCFACYKESEDLRVMLDGLRAQTPKNAVRASERHFSGEFGDNLHKI